MDRHDWLRERLGLMDHDQLDVSLLERVLLPNVDRLTCTDEEKAEILKRHEEALRRGSKTYIDPQTSFHVFTALSHLERGYCCENGCRHCPFVEGQRHR